MNQLTPTFSAVVAMAENRVIGNNNQLPWHLPADLQHFKAITLHHAILMGRKTYQSIGRALPQRLNLVLTRQDNFIAPGCTVVTSLTQALEQARAQQMGEIFIIGGAEIFVALMPQITRIYLTIVHHDFSGDAYFPLLNEHEWEEISREYHAADAANPFAYTFKKLERRHAAL